jgi:hypothetical protein
MAVVAVTISDSANQLMSIRELIGTIGTSPFEANDIANSPRKESAGANS